MHTPYEITILIMSFSAFFAALITLFSGFGLGTLLMPIMALFVPAEVAIAITAIVHLFNNIFKFFLLGKNADWKVTIRFGLPAIVFALIGAWLLSIIPPNKILIYSIFNRFFEITPLKLIIGIIISFFAIAELSPKFKNLAISSKYLPIGGALAGFFGGLTGIQGAFRSMFLIKSGLSKEAFIATGVVLAVLVDCVRILTYGAISVINPAKWSFDINFLLYPTLAAFAGVLIGKKFIKKITIAIVQNIVAIGLFFIGISMALGVI